MEIIAYYKPSVVQSIRSYSAAAGTKTQAYKTKEKYEILENCPNCKRNKKDIQKALIEGVPKPKSKEDLKKQLEELGLSGKL